MAEIFHDRTPEPAAMAAQAGALATSEAGDVHPFRAALPRAASRWPRGRLVARAPSDVSRARAPREIMIPGLRSARHGRDRAPAAP
jgi:hypothetical protein